MQELLMQRLVLQQHLRVQHKQRLAQHKQRQAQLQQQIVPPKHPLLHQEHVVCKKTKSHQAIMTQLMMILPAKITMEVTIMEMLKEIITMLIIMKKAMPTTTMLLKKDSTQKIWPLELQT
jgi:hypothetical protein